MYTVCCVPVCRLCKQCMVRTWFALCVEAVLTAVAVEASFHPDGLGILLCRNNSMLSSRVFGAVRPRSIASRSPLPLPFLSVRCKRYQAFDADLDHDALNEARSWFQSFKPEHLPQGNTTYARSSGPGGQHVNK